MRSYHGFSFPFISWGQNLTADVLVIWHLVFLPPPPSVMLRFRSCVVDVSVGGGTPFSVVLHFMVFCNGLGMLQRKISLMRDEIYTYL